MVYGSFESSYHGDMGLHTVNNFVDLYDVINKGQMRSFWVKFRDRQNCLKCFLKWKIRTHRGRI